MKPFIAAALALFALTSAVAKSPAQPATVRVRLETSAGPIVLALDAARAPKTVANFMAYVDDGRLDGTQFYRASRSKANPGSGFVQGGIGTEVRRKLPAVPFEPTSETGLRHIDATVSMARGDATSVATCNFSLLVGAHPWLDAREGSPGYAAFGKVVGGMATVKRILAMPTAGGTGAMRGQMLVKPVTIMRAVRLDGTARPTGRPKTWLIPLPQRRGQ
ncbi:MAG TPA: peptidylprolyl isomerase [Sphingobium sp.]|nr:peptidylprolyl isomerase [Sphingobium sp.]